MRKVLLAGVLATSATALAHTGVTPEAGLPKPTADQIHAVAAAVDRYRDFEVARREGWQKFGGDEPLMGEHWHHPRGPDYVDNQPLDFTRPSNLMYTDIAGRKVLTGVAFTVRIAAGAPVPDGFAGTADRWHVHDFEAAIAAALVDRPVLRWLANGWVDANYRDKGDNRGRVAMVHTWVTLPNPDGIFADYNRTLPYLKLGLPAAYARGASVEAARGLNLATAGGCAAQIDGAAWIGNIAPKTARALHAICADKGRSIRAAMATNDVAAINAAGTISWRTFDTSWDAMLTPAQRDRIAAMSEHGNHHAHGKPPRAGLLPPTAPEPQHKHH